eukprot:118973-Amphidinium_carterae.2
MKCNGMRAAGKSYNSAYGLDTNSWTWVQQRNTSSEVRAYQAWRYGVPSQKLKTILPCQQSVRNVIQLCTVLIKTLDKPDILYAPKTEGSEVSSPTELTRMKAKRLVRYPIAHSALELVFFQSKSSFSQGSGLRQIVIGENMKVQTRKQQEGLRQAQWQTSGDTCSRQVARYSTRGEAELYALNKWGPQRS